MGDKKLENIIYKKFLKASLIPILVIEVMLLILYFSINSYITSQNIETMLNEAKSNLQEISKAEAKSINLQLKEVSNYASILQKEHEHFFANPNAFALPNGKVEFDYSKENVFFKTTKIGSSLYYANTTKIGQKELNKALKTEFMDINFKNIVDSNDNIVAIYFNSFDDMNRLYPFIDDVATQYGPSIKMEDFNFYYLADLKHNPEKKPVWTSAYFDPAGNGWMVSCVVPIYNKDFLEGVTGIDITIDSFVKNILDLDLPWNAKALMIDENGVVLAMPKELETVLSIKEDNKVEKTTSITETIEKSENSNLFNTKNEELKNSLKNLKNQDLFAFSNNNTDYILSNVNIPQTNWNMMILVSKDEILKPITELENLSNKIGYTAIIAMFLFYILFFVYLLKNSKKLASTIASPIIELTEFLKNIGKKEAINIKTNIDEIDFIAKANSEIIRLNNDFIETNKKLDNLNKNLQEEIKKEIEKNRDKEAILIQQSKMASIGETISSIIHQWKQPLNNINLSSSTLRFKVLNEISNKEDTIKTLTNIESQIMLLDKTTKDFRDFFKPKNKEEFSTTELINNTISLLEKIYKQKDIEINVICTNDAICLAYKNELIQVLINLLNNARDQILETKCELKKINIECSIDENYSILEFKDYAGGIKQEILPKIFDAYFTTKTDDKGTGIGLYMSKTIVEKSGGKIEALNFNETIDGVDYQGANFKISIPLKK